MPTSSRTPLTLAAGVALLALALIAGVSVGSTAIPTSTVARVLAAGVLPAGWVDLAGVSDVERVIVWEVRAPRVVLAAVVGACLSLAGVQMQGLFRNPLASPDVIGSSAGAALGAVIALAVGLAAKSLFYLPLMSFAGSLAALFLVYAVATRRGRTPVATLLLAGVALGALLGSATSFLISAAWVRHEVAREVLFWLLGGLDSRTWEHVTLALPCLAVGLAVAMVFARDLDVLLLGEEAAMSVGADVEKLKRAVITNAALLTGGAVAVSGVVGFVGLVVPHVTRMLVGPRHGRLLPAAALTGATFLIAADLIARTIRSPEEIRLGVVTAAFGAPFFLYLLLRHQRSVGVG